jgi:hypothetical protein
VEAKLAENSRASGQGIGHDISRGESVEAEINSFIAKRHNDRIAGEGERLPKELWMESERRHNARRREENRAAWCECHQEQVERHRAVERHQDRCYHEPQLRGG